MCDFIIGKAGKSVKFFSKNRDKGIKIMWDSACRLSPIRQVFYMNCFLFLFLFFWVFLGFLGFLNFDRSKES